MQVPWRHLRIAAAGGRCGATKKITH